MSEEDQSERVVRRVEDVDLRQVGLTAQEGFVLSRVDGRTPIDLLCAITGLGESVTLATVEALQRKGIVVVESPRGSAAQVEQSSLGSASYWAVGVGSASPQAVGTSVGEDDQAQQAQAQHAQAQQAQAQQAEASPEALLDAEESQGIDLKREMRARIRTLRSQLRTLTFFELLDVPVDADPKAIRRAYFSRSKEYHPDRYYTKNLGPYKEMLAEIFRQVKGAYEFLLDDNKREAYRGTIEQQYQTENLEKQLARETNEALGVVEFDQETPTAPPRAEPRQRNRTVTNLMQKHLRDQFRVGRPNTPEGPAGAASKRSPGSTTEPLRPTDNPARATRRELDRIRHQRQRKKTFTAAFSQRRDKAAGFYAQGVKQLEEGKPLAAAASLRLAASFEPENQQYREQYQIAMEASRSITAENYFKRALFEESVGRFETAASYFQQAADAYAKDVYLLKATELTLVTGELIKSREYATKAVQIASDSIEARLALAKVLLAMGQKQAARREADVAKKLSPGNPEVKELLKQIKRS